MKKSEPIELAIPHDQIAGGNCGVTAIAVITGKSLESCFDLFRNVNPDKYARKSWKGATSDKDRAKVMDLLGLKYRKVTGYIGDSKWFGKRKFLNFDCDPITLRKYIEWHCKSGTTYKIITTLHVQVVKDGWVIDQSGRKPIDEFWGKNKRVVSVWEIFPKRQFVKVMKNHHKIITPLVKQNPRKKGTFGYHSMEIILRKPDGIRYDEFLQQGGRHRDLVWDKKKGHVEWN